VKVSNLSADDFAARIRHDGVHLRTGPFVTHVRSAIPRVIEGIHLLYADYPLEDTQFADFHIELSRPRLLRRWWRPQVNFYFDGHAPFKPLPCNESYAMFEWGMNWCVANFAHRYLMIHAAVVEKNGRALIMPAPPGSGKSTLCAALVTRGWRLLSDELTLIALDAGVVVPVPRPVSLKNRSIEVMRAFAPYAVMGPLAEDTNKGAVAHMRAPAESIERAGEAARPAWIVLPRYEAYAATRLEPQGRAGSFMWLAENSFNYSVLGRCGFEGVADLVEGCECYRFTYSQLEEAIGVFDELAGGAA
jgi:HprK-related kinase A